jgi:hypothetical protein
MDMETLILNNLDTYVNTYDEVLTSFTNIKDIYLNNVLTIFTTSLEDKVLIDSETLNYIITLLEKIYANNLALLFLMSCLSSLYVCTYTRQKKDYIMINNVEPKILKGTAIEKV